jgi:hypothetical protein
MKASHEKAREAIYRQRFLNYFLPAISNSYFGHISHVMLSYVSLFRNPGSFQRGSDRLIDLHGLHVSEAIHILKVELGSLRSAARAAGERVQVMICVGTGHHTKGSRTARLPIAVEQFLLDEGLHYTQPQPGLLRVAVY